MVVERYPTNDFAHFCLGRALDLSGRTDRARRHFAIAANLRPDREDYRARLRSEGKQYADMLKGAGVKVDYKLYNGTAHEFFGMGAVVPDAKQAVKQAASGLRDSFAAMARDEDKDRGTSAGSSKMR